jgi:hypothetical protein
MHDISFIGALTTGLTRAMQIYALKMNQWFNGGDDF